MATHLALCVCAIGCLLAIAGADLPSFEKFEELDFIRFRGYLPIDYDDVQVGTTELLVVTKSHGNPPAGRIKRAGRVTGGDWVQAIYAGDDDKSVEIWYRYVTRRNRSDLGQLDTNNADKKAVVRIVFDGHILVGNTVGQRQNTGPVKVQNSGSGPFLVVFASDNRGDSDMADEELYVGTDDPTFYYVVEDNDFEDTTIGRRRGAIASIELLTTNCTEGVSSNSTTLTTNCTESNSTSAGMDLLPTNCTESGGVRAICDEDITSRYYDGNKASASSDATRSGFFLAFGPANIRAAVVFGPLLFLLLLGATAVPY